MLIASNRGVGMNIGFPDVCLTPAGPAMVPIPYPNLAMNAMAAPFSPTVMVSMMPALNMLSTIPMTMGDEPGVGSPNMGPGRYTAGSPIVFIDGMPGINLLCPTTGNNMVNPLGAVLVPSVANVFYCRARPGVDAPQAGDPHARVLEAGDLQGLHEETACSDDPGGGRLLREGVGYLRIALFTPDLSARVHVLTRALEREGMRALVLDLRGNPGGELDALLRLADDFLPRGSVLLRTVDADGDEEVHRARQDDPYPWPLALLVDGGTASAAELFAACLQGHRRALVVGERTYGKASAQRVMPGAGGRGAVYASAIRCLLPSGESHEGRGVHPDVVLRAGEDALAALSEVRDPSRWLQGRAPSPALANASGASAVTSGKSTSE